MSKKTQHLIAFAIIGIVLWGVVKNHWNIGVDDSDLDGWNRSGVAVITDHKTGLQYLSTWAGGITPRLDTSGQQVRVSALTQGDGSKGGEG